MRKKFFIFWGLLLATVQAIAQTTSVVTMPHGMTTITAPAGSTTYTSLPLSNDPIYTGTVATVASAAITVATAPTQFNSSLAVAGTPYFVKFLSGTEIGRTLLITANTTTSLTLSVTDNGSASVPLNTTGFAVNVGDSFEVLPGDTMASNFGANTALSPLMLTSGTSSSTADWVELFNPASSSWQIYYFSSSLNYWVLQNSSSNANNVVVYPNSSVAIYRHTPKRGTTVATATLTLTGRVAEVPVLLKAPGSSITTYTSTGYPVGTTLAKLAFGSNWLTGSSSSSADQIGIWSNTSGAFTSYYELSNLTWRLVGSNSTSNQSSVVVPAGTCITLLQRSKVSGSTLYMAPAIPYSVSH